MVSSVDTFFQHENCHHPILVLDVSKTTPDLSDSADRPEDLPISLCNGKKNRFCNTTDLFSNMFIKNVYMCTDWSVLTNNAFMIYTFTSMLI